MSRDFSRFPVPALTAIAKSEGDDPVVTVYILRAAEKIIVCPNMIVEGGIYGERDVPISVPLDSSSEALGQNVWEALLSFRRVPGVNLRSQKETDWPAYHASGARSVRAFKEELVRVSVRAFPCVLRVEATVPAASAEGLYVGREITTSCEFEALGDLIHLVYRCSLQITPSERK